MMPLQLSPVDVRIVSTPRQSLRRIARRLEQTPSFPLSEQDQLRRQLLDVDVENARLAAEVRRLQEENQDLRDAAEIWIGLYERQLTRANEAVQDAGAARRK